MHITIDIDDDIIEKAINITGAKTKSQAIQQVLEDYIREQQQNDLLEKRGKPALEEK